MNDLRIPPYFADSIPGRAGWPIALAHRGADIQRENTMGAVRDAVDQGFGYIEIDVRTSADGKVVVFHDEKLDRITTGRGKLSQYAWDELSSLTVVGPRPRQQQVAEPLILFEDLLEAFPYTKFNVDLKDRASAAPMAQILQNHRALERVLVTSFRDSYRRRFFAHLQSTQQTVASSAGVETVAALLLAHRVGRFSSAVRRLRKNIPFHALQIPVRKGPTRIVTKRFVDSCHRTGIAVHVWVVNDRAEMDRLLAMGVDGLVTDNGAALAQVLEKRGQWPQRL